MKDIVQKAIAYKIADLIETYMIEEADDYDVALAIEAWRECSELFSAVPEEDKADVFCNILNEMNNRELEVNCGVFGGNIDSIN